MVRLLQSRKRVFWEALILTIVVFLFGLLIGIFYESTKSSDMNEYYVNSELSLMDIFALNSLLSINSQNCDVLTSSNLEFADKIYQEAVILEKYESVGKVTEHMEVVHKRYDVLRTFLWINTIKTSEKCEKDYSTVVYLYEYFSKDLTQKAKQNVWSKILSDLKQEQGRNILLIPIASDTNLSSLNALTAKFNITSYPVVIINEKHVISDLSSVQELERYLK
ncbi:MAG: hypothetical protein BWY36_00273 [Candidatus Diapherotrites archaeon ADurb.Bin253]|jgi:hypothetical protein|nr:MAG: hypothetical protein BWY36_00273 [Candidatus Diapherotrites archaeon ADurb.Bin253]HNZ52210.1 hypothetical protein [Candidatus Pacearchaeota archaeon]HOC96943.1 hypothetical protein [Candidatus Pacearchaeota archaeon]HOH04203.1 hypothetical protein [Candidatus Pacearchaeota archaeon]HOR52157.1 hypothetical protein [Candidatus Pacearchaeota archaeon]